MTQKTLFVRKIVYLVLIAVLLIPIYILGNPSHKQEDGSFTEGGVRLVYGRRRFGVEIPGRQAV